MLRFTLFENLTSIISLENSNFFWKSQGKVSEFGVSKNVGTLSLQCKQMQSASHGQEQPQPRVHHAVREGEDYTKNYRAKNRSGKQ